MKLTELNQDVLRKAFGVYRDVLKSHYPTPNLDNVLVELKNTRRFEFKSGPEHIWISKFVIVQDGDEITFHFEYEMKIESSRIKAQIEKFKDEFERKITII